MGQKQNSRPAEMPAVRTTIVGGRPPGGGKMLGAIPRGIEVLVKKAVVDPRFRVLLLSRRAQAADEIGLALTPQETLMLNHVPAAQLEAIIARTRVDPSRRNAFLSKAAGVMLAALGASTGLDCTVYSAGISPPSDANRPAAQTQPAGESAKTRPAIGGGPFHSSGVAGGARADRPATSQATSRSASRPANVPMAGDGDVQAPPWPEVAGAKADRPPITITGERADLPASSSSPQTQPASRPSSGPASQPASRPALSDKEFQDLLRQLDDDEFPVREAAQKKLMEQGIAILPKLRETLQGKDLSAEQRSRLESVASALAATTKPARPPRERPMISIGIAPIQPDDQ